MTDEQIDALALQWADAPAAVRHLGNGDTVEFWNISLGRMRHMVRAALTTLPNRPEIPESSTAGNCQGLLDSSGAQPQQREAVQPIPEGMVLVPKEPTKAMLEARLVSGLAGSRKRLWSAMLAAAPKVPQDREPS